MELHINQEIKQSRLTEWLYDNGFREVNQISEPGDYNHQGSLVRIYPVDSQKPIIIDFFGDQIESMILYDIVSSEKIENAKQLKLLSNYFISNGEEFFPGNYVVHLDHGIGIFWGLGLKKIENRQELYIFIEYENNNRLFVPFELADKINRYIGVGARKPKLNRLGSTSWQNTKRRVYESIYQLARDLLSIAAKREIHPSPPMFGNPEWQKKLSSDFLFKETPDQQKAIDQVGTDLAKPKPMDRLIVGDVGFGKTEVALRALLQAVASGYQVAVLAPTTLLVEQHFINFNNRLKDLPIKLTRLSRLGDSKTSRSVIQGLKDGQVDTVIGTHRLLGKEISFKKLGLLIIDEEQKFGVVQKEKLKKLKKSVDVLTLSATPIPRTLFLSLSGLRDISRIETPPTGRLPIETEVKKFDEELVTKYIRRELRRKGQVFYLHNNVSTIIPIAEKLKRLIPEARITIAHGQMEKELLMKNMANFANRNFDILVCSTIIENGLDLPNVNTLIVEDADRFGLADLYQIRGRIGRSDRQAYSLFTLSKQKITANAMKRLKSLADFSAIGSGWQIALSDLKIRGGGNVLGREQHGNMESLGLVLYARLLEQVVQKIKSTSF